MTLNSVLRWLIKNPGWRLLSLLLATLIWMNVATEPEMSTLISATVQFRDPPEGLEVTGRAPEAVQLETRGSSGQLRDLANLKPAITLDFGNVHDPGERTFSITRGETNLPRGVELIRATPAQLRFRFERTGRYTVPVKVRFLGALPNGLRMDSFTVEPPMQTIAGPDSHARAVKEVLTDSIDLAAVDPGNPAANTAVYLNDSQVRFLTAPQVTVRMVLK